MIDSQLVAIPDDSASYNLGTLLLLLIACNHSRLSTLRLEVETGPVNLYYFTVVDSATFKISSPSLKIEHSALRTLLNFTM